MDGLEISCPVDVSVPAKLMGSEGCGGVRVSSNKGDKNCESARVNSISKKGGGSSSGASDSSLWSKLMHSHNFVHDRLTKLRVENSSENQNGYLSIASPESAESPKKRGKLSRSSSSNGSLRRTKLIPVDETVSTLRENDTKEICGQGTTNSDKPLMVKQRNGYSGRRGDKKNSKFPTRTLSTINSATGENAFFAGAYGLKPDINDVTKLIEDLSLDKLLEGSYECPSLGKDKMKKSENANDALMSVVRNVWSILPTKKPVQSQSSTELDACLMRTLGSSPSSLSTALNDENIDKVNTVDGDLSSSSKDQSFDSEIPSNPLNFPLCEATDVLKRLGLYPSKDLDSLLQDASKPSQNSKNNLDQQRSGKPLPARDGLPHFPWSQALNGSSRTNSEAIKLQTGKTLCQGRWLRIADTTMSSPKSLTENFANLESITFHQNLVPRLQKQAMPGTKTPQTISANTISCQCTEASGSSFQKASGKEPKASGKEPEEPRDVRDDVISSPEIVAAAESLCHMSVQPASQTNQKGILRLSKKLSQKSINATGKSKLIEKPFEKLCKLASSSDLNSSSNKTNKNHVRKEPASEHNHHHHHQHKPSKKLKLSTMETKKVPFPSPSSSAIELNRKHSSSSTKFKNHSRMMPPPPPPTRPLQKPSIYPQKTRKFPRTG